MILSECYYTIGNIINNFVRNYYIHSEFLKGKEEFYEMSFCRHGRKEFRHCSFFGPCGL